MRSLSPQNNLRLKKNILKFGNYMTKFDLGENLL